MALSFSTVQKVYQVFHEVKKQALPDLQINSWPQDMEYFTNAQKDNPPELELLGWGKKSDDGWESLTFFIKNPSGDLLRVFNELKSNIKSNSSICEPYHRNPKIWCIGWY